MDKKIVIGLVLVASLLVACSGSPEVSGRKIAPPTTGAFVAEPDPIPEAPQNVAEKTAAEALQEAKKTTAGPVTSASSLYPPVVSDKTGKDALAERTRAAFSTGAAGGAVDADSTFGSKYYTGDGKPKNLPEGYGEDRVD